MVAHAAVLRVLDAVLGKQLLHLSRAELADTFGRGAAREETMGLSHGYNCHLHQLIVVGAGNRAQPLHEDLSWGFCFDARIEPGVSSMWALDDFTAANGATRVVLGSHRWNKATIRRQGLYSTAKQAAVPVEMPRGSVLLFLSHTLHSGGANASEAARWGLNVDYKLNWLRDEAWLPASLLPALLPAFPRPSVHPYGSRAVRPASLLRGRLLLGLFANGCGVARLWTFAVNRGWVTSADRQLLIVAAPLRHCSAAPLLTRSGEPDARCATRGGCVAAEAHR